MGVCLLRLDLLGQFKRLSIFDQKEKPCPDPTFRLQSGPPAPAPPLKMTTYFQSPYEQYGHLNGQPYTLIGKADPSDPQFRYDEPEVGAMYRIRFADGLEILAWPEEISDALENA